MTQPITVHALIDGAVLPLSSVPDPVFSQHMLGEGIALDPSGDTLCACFDGKVTCFNKNMHAFVLSDGNIELLVHVGLETVALEGEGFTPLVAAGDCVKQGQPVLKFHPQLLAQKIACPFILLVVTSPVGAQITTTKKEVVKKGEPLFTVTLPAQKSEAHHTQSFTDSAPITLLNIHGLHARPAGVLAKLAAQFPYPIELLANEKAADAKSIVSVMGLGLDLNDTVTVRVHAPQKEAARVIAAMEKGFASRFGETEDTLVPAAPQLSAGSGTDGQTEKAQNTPAETNALTGLCASEGIVQGDAFLWEDAPLSYEEECADPQAAVLLLETTLRKLTLEKEEAYEDAQDDLSAGLLAAQIELLKDPTLRAEAKGFILSGKSAAYAFAQAVDKVLNVFAASANKVIQERQDDLKDLRRTVLRQLSGQNIESPRIPDGCILIAKELFASDMAEVVEHASGVVLANGGLTSHASILLRNEGIPLLVQAGPRILQTPPDALVCLDATGQTVLIEPTEEQEAAFLKRLRDYWRAVQQEQRDCEEPAFTKDNVRISVSGNLSDLSTSSLEDDYGADGIGLVRTEFLFQLAKECPTEEEQRAVYQYITDAFEGKPVTFRLMDTGGDKPSAFVKIPPEDNPLLGLRGVRVFKKNEDFFRMQLRALLRVKPTGPLKILLPMVTFPAEIAFWRNLINEEKEKMAVSTPVELGVMIEVPAAALAAEQLAREADFFSIGTNDLTQYTLAIDRTHRQLSRWVSYLEPSVLTLIGLACKGAAKYKRPVAVCGGAAGDRLAALVLIGLGVRELAASAKMIASLKTLLRKVTVTQCEQLAEQACRADNAAAVKLLAEKLMEKL
jgi:phosphoenolpyruvate-protein phosphotransferase